MSDFFNRRKPAFFRIPVIMLFCSTLISPALLSATDVAVSIEAAKVVGGVRKEIFGQNMAIWEETENGRDREFNELMKAMEGFQVRYPGGGYADLYAWDTMGLVGSAAWTKSNQDCIEFVRSFGGVLQPCVNFSGYWNDTQHGFPETLKKAAAWVKFMNVDNSMGLRYWEIGNEQGQAGEQGHTTGDDYGAKFAQFYKVMKEVDSTIKIGFQVSPYDDLKGNEKTWTKLAMAACKKAGVTPDFLIVHEYPNRSPRMSPATDKEILRRSLADIKTYTQNLDTMVSAYFGASSVGKMEYWMTEYRSSLGNYLQNLTFLDAMFTAQYLMEMVKYKWDGANIWDIKNGIDGVTGGDYGIVSKPWRFEAEKAALSGGAAAGKEYKDASNGEYVTGFGATGASASFKIAMASDGEVDVIVAYGNGTAADQKLTVYCNDVKAGTVSLPTLGKWSTWAQGRIRVKARKGANTLVLKSEMGDGPAVVDYIYVSGAVPEIEGFRLPAYNNHPRPVFYVFPLLSSRLLPYTVNAASDNPLVSSYASRDEKGNVTLLMVNNSFTTDLLTSVTVNGITAGVDGEAWIMEGAGITPSGATEPPQQRTDVQINGVRHPVPDSVKTMAGAPIAVGKQFAVKLPKSSITIVKIPVTAEKPERLEAEDALYTPGLYISTAGRSYSGEGFLEGFKDNPGESVTFYIKSVFPGGYKVKFRYANAAGSDQKMSLYLDKKHVKDIVFPKLADPSAWGEVTETIELAEGSNPVIVKREPGDGYVNIDYAEVGAPQLEKLEAEKAVLSGGASAATDHKGYSGTGFVAGYYDNPGASTAFKFTAPRTGGYKAVLLYANSMGSTQKISLYVNGRDAGDVQFPNLADWDTWSMKFVPVTLAEGANTIAFKKDSGDGCINFDYIYVVEAPASASASAVKYEAEDGELAHGAWAPKNKPDASGASYVEGWYGNIGASVTFNVTVKTAGKYTVTLHYSNAMGSQQRMSIYVNGKDVMNANYPNHANWTTWYDDAQVLELNAGENAVMFKSDAGDGCINFDYILVEPQQLERSSP